MSKTNMNALVPIAAQALMTSDIQINKEDVLAVAVSRAEEHMHEQLALANQARLQADKEVDAYSKEIDAQLQLDAKRHHKAWGIKFQGLLAELGLKKTSVTVTGSHYQAHGTKPTYSVTLRSQTECGSNLFTHSHSVVVPAPIVALAKKSVEAQAVSAKASSDSIEWKRKMSQLPTLERKYRARLAEARIGSEEGGQELLAHIIGNVQKDVLRLSVR